MSNGTAEKQWAGGCNCGAVRYHLTVAPGPVLNCHWRECLKHHGHVGAYAKVSEDAIVFDESRGLKWWRSPVDERRAFCVNCGSSICAHPLDETTVYIAPGTLDDASDLVTTRHMCADEKPPYYEITDGLPLTTYEADE